MYSILYIYIQLAGTDKATFIIRAVFSFSVNKLTCRQRLLQNSRLLWAFRYPLQYGGFSIRTMLQDLHWCPYNGEEQLASSETNLHCYVLLRCSFFLNLGVSSVNAYLVVRIAGITRNRLKHFMNFNICVLAAETRTAGVQIGPVKSVGNL
jgi:hypothetical protein